MRKDRQAKDSERNANERERYVHRMCDSILANARMRAEAQREEGRKKELQRWQKN